MAFGSPVFFGSQPLPPPPYGDHFYDYDGYGYGTLDLPKFMPTKTRGGQRILGDLIKFPLDILCRITGGLICFNKPPGGGGGGGGGGGDGSYTYEDM